MAGPGADRLRAVAALIASFPASALQAAAAVHVFAHHPPPRPDFFELFDRLVSGRWAVAIWPTARGAPAAALIYAVRDREIDVIGFAADPAEPGQHTRRAWRFLVAEARALGLRAVNAVTDDRRMAHRLHRLGFRFDGARWRWEA
jgi:hypothetical protein